MSLNRWSEVDELFHQLLDLDPDQRAAHLASVDAEVREDVCALLDSYQSAEADSVRAREISQDNNRIGAYTLVRELGEGGMGTVYLAERADAQFEKQVAIKVIRAGPGSNALIQRFHTERQILAGMEHPYIARLLDGGITPSGQPYFVMDYVEGERLDKYCDHNKLGITGRLELLRKVAAAVEHAHLNLVVHRDLKPSNILVSPNGEPKLLDFGIAKVAKTARVDTDQTATVGLFFTPMYASPELLQGLHTTVAADVYSLGVIMYQLLTGRLPHDQHSTNPMELMSAVISREPQLPSLAVVQQLAHEAQPAELAVHRGETPDRLRRILSGDLDGIVLKALSKDPKDRYSSVEKLSADIARYLEGKPVLARKQTEFYRTQKFVRRNWRAIGLALAVFLAVILAVGYAFWQQQQKLEAGRQAQAVRSLLLWAVGSSNTLYGGHSGMTVRELVVRANARLDFVPVISAAAKAELKTEFADFLAQDGDSESAWKVAKQGVETASTSGDSWAQVAAGLNLSALATQRGDCTAATKQYAIIDPIFGKAESSLPPLNRAIYYLTRGESKLYCENDPAGFTALNARLPEVLDHILDDEPALAMPSRVFKAIAANHLAQSLLNQKKYDEAEALVAKALVASEKEPDAINPRIALLRTLAEVRYVRHGAEDLRRSARDLEEALLLAPGYTSPYEYIRLKVLLASRLSQIGDPARAGRLIEESITQARSQEAELSGQGWRIDADSAYTLALWVRDCSTVPELVSHAEHSLKGEPPPAWRAKMLAATGVCQVAGGDTKGGSTSIERAIKLSPLVEEPVRKSLSSRGVAGSDSVKALGR